MPQFPQELNQDKYPSLPRRDEPIPVHKGLCNPWREGNHAEWLKRPVFTGLRSHLICNLSGLKEQMFQGTNSQPVRMFTPLMLASAPFHPLSTSLGFLLVPNQCRTEQTLRACSAGLKHSQLERDLNQISNTLPESSLRVCAAQQRTPHSWLGLRDCFKAV